MEAGKQGYQEESGESGLGAGKEGKDLSFRCARPKRSFGDEYPHPRLSCRGQNLAMVEEVQDGGEEEEEEVEKNNSPGLPLESSFFHGCWPDL